MGSKQDRGGEKKPYEPWPYYLSREAKYPDIEDAIEDILSFPAHFKHRPALVRVFTELDRYFCDPDTKHVTSELFTVCNDLRKTWAANLASYPLGKMKADRLVGWAFTSTHRQFYMVPAPWDNMYLPLLPKADLGLNRQLIVFGVFLGSADFPKDLERLLVEMEFGDACWSEIRRRIEKKTIGGAYLSIIHGSEEIQQDALRQLHKEAKAVGRKYHFHPDKRIDLEEKISVADWLITQDVRKLQISDEESPYRVAAEILGTQFEYLPRRINIAYIDKIRQAAAKKRIPEDMIDSVEEHPDQRVEMEGLSEEPEQWDKARQKIEARAGELRDVYGPRAPDLLLLMLGDEKMTNVQIGEHLGISDRQVKNVKRALRDHPDVLRDVLGLE